MLNWDSKKSTETDDRYLDWSLRLDTGDSISTSSWAVVGSPTSLTLGANSHTTTRSKIILSGGVDKQTYRLQNTIVTTNGGGPLVEFVTITIRDA